MVLVDPFILNSLSLLLIPNFALAILFCQVVETRSYLLVISLVSALTGQKDVVLFCVDSVLTFDPINLSFFGA